MKKVIALFSAAAIFVWILPLGSFIKPSQEKTACDGRRGMHMCSAEFSEVSRPDSGSQKISFTNASGFEKTQKSSSGSAGNDFTASIFYASVQEADSKFVPPVFMVPAQVFLLRPDPVPKA